MVVAITALEALEVVFEIARSRCRFRHRRNRFRGQQRASEIRVQDGTREVEDWPEMRLRGGFDENASAFRNRRFGHVDLIACE